MRYTMVPNGVFGRCCLAAGLLLAALAPVVQAADWTAVTSDRAAVAGSPVRETAWTLPRPPGGPFDRIGLHRYRGPGAPIATLLYLPGTNMNGEVALADERHNLWLYLAARGVEVFTLDYRTHAVPADAPPAALAALRGWDTPAFLGDIAAASAEARRLAGRERLFVAGFSRGGVLAYAHALTSPEAVAGVVVLDAPFKNRVPGEKFDAAAALARLDASGAWASDVAGSRGWEWRQRLMQAVVRDPAAPSSDARFATVGEELAEVLQTAWTPGGLANLHGGFSQARVLARLLADYDRWYPAVQDVDQRSIADHADDPRTPIDDRWGRLDAPVLAFVSTGLGPDWVANARHSAEASGSRDVTVQVLDGWGHLDVVAGEQAAERVYAPVLAWLRERAR
ncbi:alpha/beta hydrolase [Xylophilus sp.]|uniref:alpha/beta hydrolase n=1 Tax=Xylophilus sp. TaxID=2653893 RepID=UPI003FCE2501